MKIRSATLLAAVLACAAAAPAPVAAAPTPAAKPAHATAPTTTSTAAAKLGRLYVGDTESNKIYAFDSNGAAAPGFTPADDAYATGGMVVDPATNTLYACSATTQKLLAFDAKTGAAKSIAFPDKAVFSSCMTLVRGTLYVCNGDSKNVMAFNAATGAPVAGGCPWSADLSPLKFVARHGETMLLCGISTENGQQIAIIKAFNAATGAPAAGFTPIRRRAIPGMALSGNRLFVLDFDAQAVAEFDATTGAEVNAQFISGLTGFPDDLKVLGNNLYILDNIDKAILAYPIPAAAGGKSTVTKIPLISYPKGMYGLAVAP